MLDGRGEEAQLDLQRVHTRGRRNNYSCARTGAKFLQCEFIQRGSENDLIDIQLLGHALYSDVSFILIHGLVV